MLVYPMSVGRNFDEGLRLRDAIQLLNAKHTVATSVNWKPGQDVILPTAVSDDEAKQKYPQGSGHSSHICAPCPNRGDPPPAMAYIIGSQSLLQASKVVAPSRVVVLSGFGRREEH